MHRPATAPPVPLLTAICLWIGIFVFSLTSLAVIKDILRPSDFALTVKLQDRFPARFDDNIVLLVDLASMEVQAVAFLVTLAVLPLSIRTKIALCMFYGLGLAIVLLGKHVIPQPAPPYMFQRGNQGLAFPSMHVQVESSYPSGHTYRIAFLGSMLFLTWVQAKTRGILLTLSTIGVLTLTGLIMIGLVVLGKHWATDLIGGGSLAIILASVPFMFLSEDRPIPK